MIQDRFMQHSISRNNFSIKIYIKIFEKRNSNFFVEEEMWKKFCSILEWKFQITNLSRTNSSIDEETIRIGWMLL